MKVVYSFVIDGAPEFVPQARTFLTTLIASGVKPEQIIAHVTPAVTPSTRKMVESFDVVQVELHPCLDQRFCNKIAQLSYLRSVNCDSIVLCDTDLAFLEPLGDIIRKNRVSAKPVDAANPPVEKLAVLAELAGIRNAPQIVRTSCTNEPTWKSNCNGGIYILPHAILGELQQLWSRYAELALNSEHILAHKTKHADQIGFALAMLVLNIEIDELPLEYNFPIHIPHRFKIMTFSAPKILHYHKMQTPKGFLAKTGNKVVDAAVERVNLILRNYAPLGSVGGRSSDATACAMAGVENAFLSAKK